MRNKLSDLNNHLFEQLERLNDDDLSGEDFEREIQRSRAMSDISRQIIDNAKVQLDVAALALEYGANVSVEDVLMIGYEKVHSGDA